MAVQDFNSDPDGYLTQLIQAELQKQQTSQQPDPNTNVGGLPPAGQAPLSINIGGQPVQFRDLNELQATLNQTLGAAAQNQAALQHQLEQANAVKQEANVTNDDSQPWNVDHFVKEMTEDPRRGFGYMFNQLLYDGKSENPIGDLKQMVEDNEKLKRAIAAYQFTNAHPEYPGTAQVADVVEKWRQQMNLPYDYNGIEAAYQRAIAAGPQNGGLPDFQGQYRAQQRQQQQAQQAQSQTQVNPYAGQPYEQQGFAGQPYSQQGFAGQPTQQQAHPMDPRQFNGGGVFAGINAANNPYLNAPPGIPRTGAPQFSQNGPITLDMAEKMDVDQLESVLQNYQNRPQGGRPW